MIVHKTFKYRLYPTRTQAAALVETLDRCREIYNAALEQRREAYRMQGKSLSYYDQSAEMPGVKKVRPEYATMDAQMVREPLQRLHKAFQAFFRRIKAGERAGFPRFKSRDRYNSFTFYDHGWALAANRLTLRGIGALKIRLHRPVQGTIKTVTIRREADHWYVTFSCTVCQLDAVYDTTRAIVGIDVGLEHFATLSTGEHIANPRFFRMGHGVLSARDQSLSRKNRGSNRRKKAKLLVAKAHRKVRNQRKDFHHKTARTLVQAHSLIAVEALQVANMTKRAKPILDLEQTTVQGKPVYAHNGAAAKAGLNKSIHDAGWSQFISFLTYKAEEAGCQVVQVNPAGTSQACSDCGALCPKSLSERWHHCDHCGCSLQRDVNAARNILARAGQVLQVGA